MIYLATEVFTSFFVLSYNLTHGRKVRSMIIQHWQSEHHYQHQNFLEHHWQHFKHHVNWFMNWQNIDPEALNQAYCRLAWFFPLFLVDSFKGSIPRGIGLLL
jgi:hypothetical protein